MSSSKDLEKKPLSSQRAAQRSKLQDFPDLDESPNKGIFNLYLQGY